MGHSAMTPARFEGMLCWGGLDDGPPLWKMRISRFVTRIDNRNEVLHYVGLGDSLDGVDHSVAVFQIEHLSRKYESDKMKLHAVYVWTMFLQEFLSKQTVVANSDFVDFVLTPDRITQEMVAQTGRNNHNPNIVFWNHGTIFMGGKYSDPEWSPTEE